MPGANIWFDHWFKPGWLTTLVQQEHEVRPAAAIDSESLIASYRDRGHAGIVRMLEYLGEREDNGTGITLFGSASIITSQLSRELTYESFMALQELYVGDVRRGITPLAWFAYVERNLYQLPDDLLVFLDRIMGTLADSMKRVRR